MFHCATQPVAMLASLILVASSAAAESLTPIPILPGGDYRIATAISGDGSAVTGYGPPAGAIRWIVGGGWTALGAIPGDHGYSYGAGISADGSVVVGRSEWGPPFSRSTQASRWTSDGGMVGLGYLNGGLTSEAKGVSADGTVVVGFGNSSALQVVEAFRWTAAEGMRGLGSLPGGQFSVANAVSGDGSVVVGRSNTASDVHTQAFRWTAEGGMVGLGFLPDGGYTSDAFAASYDGSVIVGTAARPGRAEAFLWTAGGGMVGLGVLPGKASSEAYGVSGDGSVVVGANYGGVEQAFIWTRDSGMRSLLDVLVEGGATDLNGWQIRRAVGISADGRSVLVFAEETSTLASGFYVAHLVPAPPAILLLSTALLAFPAWRARRVARTAATG